MDLEDDSRERPTPDEAASLVRLAAVLANEIRNPLGVIQNAVSLARRAAPPDETVSRMMALVSEETERIDALVEDLIVFARPLIPDFRREPVGALFEMALETLRHSRAGREPAVDVVLHGFDPGPFVRGDRHLLTRAFTSVLRNACQAMPQGGTLTLELTVAAEGLVLARVTDTGPGLAEEAKAGLFQPFFTTRARGRGLGLYFVKRILEAHGGTVSVRSAPGQGTTVRLALPRDVDERAD